MASVLDWRDRSDVDSWALRQEVLLFGNNTMRIAIFFAMEDEFIPFRNLARSRATDLRIKTDPPFDARHGLCFRHRGNDVCAAITGAGLGHAFDMASDPFFNDRDCFVAAGVSGAITAALGIGAVVVASRVWRMTELECDLQWVAPATLPFMDARAADVITSSRALCKREQKAGFLNRWQATAGGAPAAVVDMESAGVAWAAQLRNASFMAIRAVSDTADEDLPLDFNLYLAPNGSADRGRIMREAMRRPTLIPALLRLGRNTKLACLRLAVAVWNWLEQAPADASARR